MIVADLATVPPQIIVPRDAAYSATMSSWRKLHRADPNQFVDLNVVLQAPGRDALEKTFWAVSTPTNPAYGQHKKLDEIAAILAVPQERVDRVKAHFGSATSLTLSPTRDMLKVRIPVAAAERALACEQLRRYGDAERDARELGGMPEAAELLRSSAPSSTCSIQAIEPEAIRMWAAQARSPVRRPSGVQGRMERVG